MANKRAKRIVKEAFEREGLEWSIIEEQSWSTCVKYNYFKGNTSVWDYIYYLIHFNLPLEQWKRIKAKYRKQPLPW